MFTHDTFLELIDQFKKAAEIDSDGALSARMFNDSKKITALRDGKDITLGRLNSSIKWMRENWPKGSPLPKPLAPPKTKEAAQ